MRRRRRGQQGWLILGLCFGLCIASTGSALAAGECGPALEILEDPAHDFSGPVEADRAPGWRPVRDAARSAWLLSASDDTPVLGLRDATIWLRLRPVDPAAVLLSVEYPPLDHVILHYPEAASLTGRAGGAGKNVVLAGEGETPAYFAVASGDRRPYGASGILHRNFVFHLPRHAIGRCVYLQIRSESSLVLPVRLWRPGDFVSATNNEQLMLGAYYGALGIMLVYNLFLAISLRNASYLYYVLYILAYGSYLFIWNGLALRFFWPNDTIWNSLLNPMLVCVTTALAALFTRSFFYDSPVRTPLHTRALIVLVALSFASAALAPLGFSGLVVRLSVLLSLIGVILVLWFAVRQVLGGYRPARYFLLAFAVLSAGVLANILRTAGLLPPNFYTMGYGLQASSLAEMVLLSFGLADRYRLSEDERRVAQAESAAKTMFIARMSHEIRTPLNAMLGAAQLLEETELGPEQRRYVELLGSGGRNLLGVVNDVLDLSRITSGRLTLEARPFALRAMLAEAIRIHGPPARQKGLELREELDERLPDYVVGDEFRLGRVITNLLSNAIKFTSQGHVKLTVRVAANPGGPASSTARLAPGETVDLQIRISDTGIGIPADRLNNIFVEFSQADESVTRRFGGTGLGLAISRGILEQMGGSIRVISEPGAGSTFDVRLSLPVAERPAEPHDAGARAKLERPASDLPAATATVGAGLRILLAEDNDDNRALFYAFLKQEPHNIDSVENGLEAIHKFQEQHYDVVFMDIQMPVMDGLTAVRRIRNWEADEFAAGRRTVRCPVYALSAHAFREEADRSIAAGCDGHIAKPLVKRVLLDVLATLAAR